MPVSKGSLPPEVARFSGLYNFIPPERFGELGIDPEDVPLGTFPAENHPPFLPDRAGGNAYGLGLFEQASLPAAEAALVDALDLSDPDQVAGSYRRLNDIFKRLGLLIRFSSQGRPFYLIPRQFVVHSLVEEQARADLIVEFLSGLLSRRLRETMRVGLVVGEHDLLLPELQTRMPHLDFHPFETLASLHSLGLPMGAMVVVGTAGLLALDLPAGERTSGSATREDHGYFMAGLLHDQLEEGGEVLCLAEAPLGGSRENIQVTFRNQREFKLFLIFSHVYRTRRRYQSLEGLTMAVNRFDFNAFLAGLGVYHETVEGLLEGRSLAQMEPRQIDKLPYQDRPLPRGSAERLLARWRRWFSPFFNLRLVESVLPQVQRRQWEELYQIKGQLSDTMVVLEGNRLQPQLTLAQIESEAARTGLAGCDRALLADYKDSFAYVLKVLGILRQVRGGEMEGMPGLELSRLRKPFETAHRNRQISEALELMEMPSRLERMEQRLNPDHILGLRTPVLANLEKLALMGLPPGPLRQLYLMVLGHSTMSRVTFGKVSELTLEPLSDLSRYANLEDAVAVIRLYRLLSVAEAAAAAPQGLTRSQVTELFDLYDDAIRVATDPQLNWSELINDQITRMGGTQAKAAHRLLKLFDLFDFLGNWQDMLEAGPRQKEAMADFDPQRLQRLEQVIELVEQVRRFVGHFYPANSTARPYFFRALLNCELHGTGRLLPRLGAAAGFSLLWICLHASERHLLNFNPLLEVEDPAELPRLLDRLRQELVGLPKEYLSPDRLAELRQNLARGGEAYIRGSGLHLTLDPATGAVTPRFVDADQKLGLLERELETTVGLPLDQTPNERLRSMDRDLDEVMRFGVAGRLGAIIKRQAGAFQRLQDYLLEQLFHLEGFGEYLGRLAQNCPHLLGRLLPHPVGSSQTNQKLDEAKKLSALFLRRLDLFQDLQQSHEAALAEFGPTAAGIVGVSPLQFQDLCASLSQLLKRRPQLDCLLMLAVLLDDPLAIRPNPDEIKHSPLIQFLGMNQEQADDLYFILAHKRRWWEIISGQSALTELAPLLERQDPQLIEAMFLLATIGTAAHMGGGYTEDLQDHLFRLLQKVRDHSLKQVPALAAQRQEIEEQALRYLAFRDYREIREGDAPAASLRHLLETTRLPAKDKNYWLGQGQRQAGLKRLLSLRGLVFVTPLELNLLELEVPVLYIYRLLGLRSMGLTHFERELYEGRRLARGLDSLEPDHRQFLLRALADPEHPLRLLHFKPAAQLLNYVNQIRLLFLGVSAALGLELGRESPPLVSFGPLAQVIDRKFEMVNEALGELRPRDILGHPRILHKLLRSKEGFTLDYDPDLHMLSLDIRDPARLDRKIEAVRRAQTPAKLKLVYDRELKNLELTTHHGLDYRRRMEDAFKHSLSRLGRDMIERMRREMAEARDLDQLEGLFEEAWREGLALPLHQDLQQSLRDLLEMNVERLGGLILADINTRLAQVESLAQLNRLWTQVRGELKNQRRHLGKDFDLMVAERFDRRARELGPARPASD